MSPAVAPAPSSRPPVSAIPVTYGRDPSAYQWTVQQYQRMIEVGILGPKDKVELLEGHVVLKMPRDPRHDGSITLVSEALRPYLPANWLPRVQLTLELTSGQPEPDIALARGGVRTYIDRHPIPADVGPVIEVANTSLVRDQLDKGRMYAVAGVEVYWIVNVVDVQVEVYERPAAAGYARVQVYRPGDLIPLSLDGTPVGPIPTADLLP